MQSTVMHSKGRFRQVNNILKFLCLHTHHNGRRTHRGELLHKSHTIVHTHSHTHALPHTHTHTHAHTKTHTHPHTHQKCVGGSPSLLLIIQPFIYKPEKIVQLINRKQASARHTYTTT